MTKNSDSSEHILICISPSPSNPKVITAAVKLAKAFQAALTAIYIKPTNYDKLLEEDKIRLQNNIRFAERNGASIMTIIGDDVPTQVAEYAHISNITKIVVGRSGIKRRHFWSKPPLTEQIIANVPDVDVYVIPDSVADLKKKKERLYIIDQIRPTIKDLIITLLLLAVSTCIGLLFTHVGFSDSNIITVFILGVLVISVVTVSPICGALGSLASVVLFDCFFIDPIFSFHTNEAEYSVTFVIMLVSSLITGTLANRIKRNAAHAALETFRTKILLDTNQLLQRSRISDEVLQITAQQIIVLLNRDVVIFPREDNEDLGDGTEFRTTDQERNASIADSNEKEIAEWVFYNHQAAGFRTEQYNEAKAQYHAILLNDYCYGVVAIRLNGLPLDPFENSIVMSIIGECALTLENLRNTEEKEQASVIARNEQLRSNLLRSISHDIRTPLTSISGNADNLLHHYKYLDDEALTQIFTDIHDDSEWLIDLVENLLSISRIENGQMKLNMSLEVLGDVIEEALKHIDKNADKYHIFTEDSGDILLVNIEARLIMQVLINLINNAIKNTPTGSEICIQSSQAENEAVVIVRDNGPGIPDDVKPHVFEMFYTGQNKVADGRRGLGLGLALCKSIIEAHHGRITLTDNEPSGCCFSIYLPLKEVQIDE